LTTPRAPSTLEEEFESWFEVVLIAVRRLSILVDEPTRLVDEACSVAVLPPPTATAASILDEDLERLSELVCKVPIVPVMAAIAPSTLVEEFERLFD
jgi:hypothetical protein